jgi:serine/threonine protein phosphatase PrpC
MLICPYCQNPNKQGARFCANCGKQFPSATIAPDSHQTRDLPPGSAQAIEQSAANKPSRSQSDTKPLNGTTEFEPRPKGAIFGRQYLYDQLLFTDGKKNQYIVSPLSNLQDLIIRMCPNPICGAVFAAKGGEEVEKYCTDCQTELDTHTPTLVLTETNFPHPTCVSLISARLLSHGGVRAPLLTFEEPVCGRPRYCVITPLVEQSIDQLEMADILKWGVGLCLGLEYLHSNGIFFKGNISEILFGKSGERLVWANFSDCDVCESVPVQEMARDVRALATLLYSWLTGKTQYVEDPTLPAYLNQLFHIALIEPGYASGEELANAITQARENVASQVAINYRQGKQSHVGMQRALNEDSLLAIEMCRIKQSIVQPAAIFAVADGMGGHAAGEKASNTIIDVIAEKALSEALPIGTGANIDPLQWLQEVVRAANQTVYKMRIAAGTDMGSTLVMAWLEGKTAWVAHAGDSRAYIINDVGIKQVTTDHSLVERLIAANQITREEARTHPQRSVVYRTVGDKSQIEVDRSVQTLAMGDYLLLCSDGLSSMVSDNTIREIVIKARDPQEACDSLVDAANVAGGEDNITVILVKLVMV